MNFLKSINIYRLLIGIGIGAGLGYSYYYFIGCNSGSCPITSSPLISTLYGGMMGLVAVFPSKKKVKKVSEDETENS